MKQKIILLMALIAATITFCACSSDDDDNDVVLPLMFKSTVSLTPNDKNGDPFSCMFYIFPDGNYKAIERIWGTGLGSVPTMCYAITTTGEKVLNIGWTTYNKFSDGYGEALPSDIKKADEQNTALLKGNFYVVVVPDEYHCYKAKHISKPSKYRTVITQAMFTYDELTAHYFNDSWVEIPW